MKFLVHCFVIAACAGVWGQPNGQLKPTRQLKPNQQLKPTFAWLSERSESGIPHLSIKTEDGKDMVAILRPYDPFPIEEESSILKNDPCIFKGHLANEEDAEVLVTGGCPGDDSFEIAMISKQLKGFRYQVKKGIAEQTRSPLGTPVMKDDGTMGFFRDVAVKSHQFPTQRNASLNRVALPAAGFVFRLSFIFENTYLTKYVTQTEAINAARRQIANAQLIFRWTSLTVPITLEIVSITYQNITMPADVVGLDALIPFATDNSMGSYVGLTSTGPYGGIAYQPGVCSSMMYRTAVVQSRVGWTDQTVGEIMAHELGHNLGMNHDFIDPYTNPKTIFRDSSGNTCTNVNGVMDYYVTVQKWTTCSVERFTQHYNNVVNSAGSFCLPLHTGTGPVNGSWGQWGTFGTCSLTCGNGTQSRTRLCNNPAPTNGGLACVGSATESQSCNVQSCTGNQAVYLVGGGNTYSGKVYATNPTTGISGPVCDDFWDLNTGNVVCKQLGFPLGVASVSCCSFYGLSDVNFSYDNVQCAGNETTLNACPHLNVHDCGSAEGAGVVCRTGTGVDGNWGAWTSWATCSVTCGGGNQGRTRLCNNPAPSNGGLNCTGSATELQSCNNVVCPGSAAVFLVGGTNTYSGKVYASNPTTGISGPVCDDFFDRNAGNVVCKQLGFPLGADSVSCCSFYGPSATNFAYDNVRCNGSETTLNACPHLNVHDCGSTEGAGVVCRQSGTVVNGTWGAWNSWGTCSRTCGGGNRTRTRLCNNPAPANGGLPCTGPASESQTCNTSPCPGTTAVYLVGGPSPNAGTVYATNPTTGISGPVCDDFWGINSGNVVCKQLGYPLGAQSVSCCSNYGAVPTNFSYDNVQCNGTETTLNACPHLNVHDCGSTEGAGIVCRTGTTSPATALIGGATSSEGYLYATNPVTGTYGPVCDDVYTIALGNVACRQLGFANATAVSCCSIRGAVPTNFSYDEVNCTGTEATIDACPHNNVHDCGSSEGLWIVCSTSG